MDVRPAACVVVEDSAMGVAAARAAGMRVVAYAGGVTPAEKLRQRATAVFEEMSQLPDLLARLSA
jgi:beta-phosphoglucomutase-like phosphatase (HAD superfamily)